jgi:hypothetical protein
MIYGVRPPAHGRRPARQDHPSKRTRRLAAGAAVMGQQRTPAVHTGSEKRLNPPGDLLGGFELQVHRRLRRLTHPQKNASGLGTTGHVLAPGLIKLEEAERGVDHVVFPAAPRMLRYR